ncbi:hypothetical protein BKA65DRAFT_497031 [Rhexocercosporidium sp. MPI-PUGE-AT-0058]|nr:hypothetical protein BKA65DRAFT_497031 [Rhexocercosporidium sp. MPI-PUGE-AT-0058]
MFSCLGAWRCLGVLGISSIQTLRSHPHYTTPFTGTRKYLATYLSQLPQTLSSIKAPSRRTLVATDDGRYKHIFRSK